MSSKDSIGKLPGEPKAPPEITFDLARMTGAAPGTITTITPEAGKKLLGKGSHLAVVDLSDPAYTLTNVDFLSSASKSAVSYLNVSHNSIVKLCGINHLTKMKYLIATDNNIESAEIAGLSSLKVLSLKTNQLEEIPDLSDMKKLVNIDFSHNKLVSGFEKLSDLKGVKVLNFAFNAIEMSLPEFHNLIIKPLKNLSKLEYISFEGNPIEISIPNFRMYIANELPNLRFLDWEPITKYERSQGALLDQSKTWVLKGTSFSKTAPAQRAKAKQQQEANAAEAAAAAAAAAGTGGGDNGSSPEDSSQDDRSGTDKGTGQQNSEEYAPEDEKTTATAASSASIKKKKAKKPKKRSATPSDVSGTDGDLNSLLGEIDEISMEFGRYDEDDENASSPTSSDKQSATKSPTGGLEVNENGKRERAEGGKAGGYGLSVTAPPVERKSHTKSSSMSYNPVRSPTAAGSSPTVVISHKPNKSDTGGFVLSSRKAAAMSQIISTDKEKTFSMSARFADDSDVGRNVGMDHSLPMPAAKAKVGRKKKMSLSPIVSAQSGGSAFMDLNYPAPKGAISPVHLGNDSTDAELEALLAGCGSTPPSSDISSPMGKNTRLAIPRINTKKALTIQTSFGGNGGSPCDGLGENDYPINAGSSGSFSSNIRDPNSSGSLSPTPRDTERFLKEQSDDNINNLIAQIVAVDETKCGPRTPRSAMRQQQQLQQQSQQLSPSQSPRADPWELSSDRVKLGSVDNTCSSIFGTTYTSSYEGTPSKSISATSLKAELCKDPAQFDKIWDEIGALCSLEPCVNVVKVVGASRSKDNASANIVFDPLPSGGVSLDALAHRLPAQSHIEQKLNIARGIANGLQYLHNAGVVHGTLRSSDIYLARNLEPSIRDYGVPSAKALCLKTLSSFPTVYLAPEVLEQSRSGDAVFTPKSDIYSFGIVLWQLFEGSGMDAQQVFSTTTSSSTLTSKSATDFVLPFKGSPTEISIIVKRCCARDPASRPQSMGVLFTALNRLNASTLHFTIPQIVESPQIQAADAPLESPRTAAAAATAAPAGAGKDAKLRAVAQRVIGILDSKSGTNDQMVVKGLSAAGILAQAGPEGEAIAKEYKILTLVMNALTSSDDTVFTTALDTIAKFDPLLPVYADEVRTAAVSQAVTAALHRAHTPESITRAFSLASDITEDAAAAHEFCKLSDFWPGLVKGLLSTNAADYAILVASHVLGLSAPENRVAFYNARGLEALAHIMKRAHSTAEQQTSLLGALSEVLEYPEAVAAVQKLDIPEILLCIMQLGSRSDGVKLACYKCAALIAADKKMCPSFASSKWAAAVCLDLVAPSLEIRLLAYDVLGHMARVSKRDCVFGDSDADEMIEKLVGMEVGAKIVGVLNSERDNDELCLKALELVHMLALAANPGCIESFIDENNGLDAIAGYIANKSEDQKVMSAVAEIVVSIAGVDEMTEKIAKKPSVANILISELDFILNSDSDSKSNEIFSKLISILNAICASDEAMAVVTSSPKAVESVLRGVERAADKKCSAEAHSAAGSLAVRLFGNREAVKHAESIEDGFGKIFVFITAGDSNVCDSLLQTIFGYSTEADLLRKFVEEGDLVKYLVGVLSESDKFDVSSQSQVLKIIIQILKHPELKPKLISGSVPEVLKKLSVESEHTMVMSASARILNALMK